MSRRKADGLADAARRAAADRRVVLSAGTLDGPFLAALQRLRLAAGTVPPSTWGPGVTLGDQVKGGDDGKDKTL